MGWRREGGRRIVEQERWGGGGEDDMGPRGWTEGLDRGTGAVEGRAGGPCVVQLCGGQDLSHLVPPGLEPGPPTYAFPPGSQRRPSVPLRRPSPRLHSLLVCKSPPPPLALSCAAYPHPTHPLTPRVEEKAKRAAEEAERRKKLEEIAAKQRAREEEVERRKAEERAAVLAGGGGGAARGACLPPQAKGGEAELGGTKGGVCVCVGGEEE